MNRPEFAPSDFFSRQDAARTRTGRLVVWFALAVGGTVASVYGAALLAFGAASAKLHLHAQPSLWRPELFFGCLATTLLIVGGASLFKSSQLAGGGGQIARDVGGRRVSPDSVEPSERMLLNIVEEMSLASGVPVPDVYILDHETGINAFAAGDSLENAAVAVTRGALEKLSRDELQAVMGHEFSHILNGDMRLNVRLIGWIFGLLAIAVVGRVLMEVSPRRSSGKNNGGAAMMIFGLLVMIVGYVGMFFAQLIQASISRQREHLADASATQFTRNPEALANALRRIAGESAGTRLHHPQASEVAHMCFGEGVASAFATHPPLEERIRLLKPDWDGSFLPPLDPERAKYYRPGDDATVDRHFRERFMHASAPVGTTAPTATAHDIPDTIAALTHDPLGAQATVLLLMMSDNPADNRRQALALKDAVPPELFERMKSSWDAFLGVRGGARLALVQRAAPALRHLPPARGAELLKQLRRLALSDGRVTFFELALLRLTDAILHPADDTADERSPAVLRPALRLVAGALVAADDGHDALSVGRALNLAPAFGHIADLPGPDELDAESLEGAFITLSRADYPRRRQVMAVAEELVKHDGRVNDAEADLLRALAATLRCPTTAV